MNYIDFAIAISIFLFFFAIVLMFSTNYFVNLASETKLSEFRVIAEDFLRQFTGRSGVPTDWETNLTITPVQLGLLQKLYRRRVLVDENAGINRTGMLVNASIIFDEDCANTTWNDTVRVYDEKDNSTFFTLTDQVFCNNQYLKSANVTWQVNTTNTTGNNTMKKFWIYYSADYNVTAPNYTSPFNMSAFWRFDESSGSTSALDSSIYEYDGTLTNMNTAGNATSGWSSSCKFGGCLIFDGFNDYVSFGDVLDDLDADATTLTLWLKLNSGDRTDERIIAKFNMFQFYIDSSTEEYRFFVHNSTDWYDHDFNYYSGEDTWYHISLVIGSSNIILYENGVQKASVSKAYTGSFNNGGTAYLGVHLTSSGSQYLNGTLDEVRIYNRTLTADEVNATYNSIENPISFKIFPEEEITALSPGKVRALQNVTYEELKRTMGEDYDFTVEIEERQYIS